MGLTSTHHVLRRIATLALCGSLGFVAGCGGLPLRIEAPEPGAEGFDPLTMTWSPASLAAAVPALVGWRAQADGSGGELRVLSQNSLPDPVIWRTPAEFTEGRLEIVEVAPDGSRMIGVLPADAGGDTLRTRMLLFDQSGAVQELAPPAGFDGFSDVAFVPGGVLAIAARASSDPRTEVGRFDAEGRWQPFAIVGDLREYQTVEACLTRPGSDLVGLVLKLPGGAGNRDDGMFVLARVAEGALRVVTPAFYDDALLGSQALWDGNGVVYARLWHTPEGVLAPAFVRIEWGGVSWVERELVPAGTIALDVDAEQAIVHDALGGYWVRSAPDAHLQGTTLLYVPAEGGLAPTGIDVSSITWFGWVQGPAE